MLETREDADKLLESFCDKVVELYDREKDENVRAEIMRFIVKTDMYDGINIKNLLLKAITEDTSPLVRGEAMLSYTFMFPLECITPKEDGTYTLEIIYNKLEKGTNIEKIYSIKAIANLNDYVFHYLREDLA